MWTFTMCVSVCASERESEWEKNSTHLKSWFDKAKEIFPYEGGVLNTYFQCSTFVTWMQNRRPVSVSQPFTMVCVKVMEEDKSGWGCDTRCMHLWLWWACLKRYVKVNWFRLLRATVRHTGSKVNLREMSLYRHFIGPDCKRSASIYGNGDVYKTGYLPQALFILPAHYYHHHHHHHHHPLSPSPFFMFMSSAL